MGMTPFSKIAYATATAAVLGTASEPTSQADAAIQYLGQWQVPHETFADGTRIGGPGISYDAPGSPDSTEPIRVSSRSHPVSHTRRTGPADRDQTTRSRGAMACARCRWPCRGQRGKRMPPDAATSSFDRSDRAAWLPTGHPFFDAPQGAVLRAVRSCLFGSRRHRNHRRQVEARYVVSRWQSSTRMATRRQRRQLSTGYCAWLTDDM
jgi:hypothetical protein